MACVPLSPASYDMGPPDYLNRFVSLITSLRSGQSRYLPLLQNKIAEVLPSYQLALQPRADMYGNPSQSSTPNAGDSTAYDSSSSLSLRHGMRGLHYQDSGLSPHISTQIGPSSYSSFGSTNPFQDTTTAGSLPGSALYQTHLPRSTGYNV